MPTIANPVTQTNIVTDSDISAIIVAINSLITSRSAGSAVGAPSQYTKIYGSLPQGIITQENTLNSTHTWPGLINPNGYGTLVHSNIGTNLSLTAASGNFNSGVTLQASTMNAIVNDINSLYNQCACNVVTSNYSTCSSYSCTAHACACNVKCANGYSCTCNIYDTGHGDRCMCNGINCCNYNGCTNVTCTCDYVCSAQNTCSCNNQCVCEYN